jgi:hypothetical protein
LRTDDLADQAEQIDRALRVVDFTAGLQIILGPAGAMAMWRRPAGRRW